MLGCCVKKNYCAHTFFCWKYCHSVVKCSNSTTTYYISRVKVGTCRIVYVLLCDNFIFGRRAGGAHYRMRSRTWRQPYHRKAVRQSGLCSRSCPPTPHQKRPKWAGWRTHLGGKFQLKFKLKSNLHKNEMKWKWNSTQVKLKFNSIKKKQIENQI